MSFSWVSGLQADLKLPSVRQLFNVAPETVHEDDWMTKSQGILTSVFAI